MPPELIIHVGDPKTGSSSIQQILAKSEFKAPGAEIAYPVRTLSHAPLANAIIEGGEGFLRRPEVGLLRKAYAEEAASHVVISAEQFWAVTPSRTQNSIAKILPGAIETARVLMYIRPHPERLLSSWQQRLKMGLMTDDFGLFSERIGKKGTFIYFDRVKSWRKVFGDRLEVRPFVRTQLHNQDVVHDFFRFVLQSENFEITGDTNANESLTLEQLSMLREMHLALKRRNIEKGATAMGQFVGRQIMELPVSSGKRTKIAIPAELIDEIVATYREDAEKMDATFFEGTPMMDGLNKARDKAIAEHQTLDPEAHFTPAELRVLRTWTEMVARMASIAPERLAGHLHRLRHGG